VIAFSRSISAILLSFSSNCFANFFGTPGYYGLPKIIG
jgi:hypothetical protein